MRKFLIILVILIVVGVGLYFGLNGKDRFGKVDDNSDTSSPESTVEGENTAVEPDKVFTEPIIYSSLKESYSGNNFSFKYSEGFKVTLVPMDSGQEMVTIESSKGSGFQIFTIPWDESGPITPERIWKDMPDAQINDPKNAQLDGAKALVFNGYDEDMGETFEVWAVNKGRLHQIVGPKTADKLIIETLETWGWK